MLAYGRCVTIVSWPVALENLNVDIRHFNEP